MNQTIPLQQQNRLITAGEAIAGLIIIIGACLTFWITTSTRLTTLEDNARQDGIDKTDLKISISKMDGKLDDNNTSTNKQLNDLKDNINQIKILLQNKKDR